jgi:hypothetical protein
VFRGLAGIILGAICGLGALMSVKKLDALGNRSVVVYLFARVVYNARRTVIELPLIMPVGNEALVVESWKGETLMTVGEASQPRRT